MGCLKNKSSCEEKLLVEKSNPSLLTREEERELLKQAHNGNLAAQETLILKNMGLIYTIANRFSSPATVSKEDLIQEGIIGLIKAIQRFDLTQTSKLSSYATYYIQSQIFYFIRQKNRGVAIPARMIDEYYKYQKEVQLLTKELERDPTEQEILEFCSISQKKISAFLQFIPEPLSMNEMDHETNLELGSIIKSPDSLEEQYIQVEFEQNLSDLLEHCGLKQRDIEVIKRRYGFYNDTEYTLEEIGRAMDLSKSLVDQIINHALALLRQHPKIKYFLCYSANPKQASAALSYFNSEYQRDPKQKRKKLHFPPAK